MAVKSLPTRERGLKWLTCGSSGQGKAVAPYAGAWIEIVLMQDMQS